MNVIPLTVNFKLQLEHFISLSFIIFDHGKIKVGWSLCQLSVSQQSEAWFWFHEFDQLARYC